MEEKEEEAVGSRKYKEEDVEEVENKEEELEWWKRT